MLNRNFPKSKKYTFNPNNNLFFLSENLTRMNESLAYQGGKLKRNNLVNACYTRDGIVTIKINERSKAIKIHHIMTCWNSFLILILKMNVSMMHLLIYQVSQCTELDLAPSEFVFRFLVFRREGFCSST